jgi:hypothetical protein
VHSAPGVESGELGDCVSDAVVVGFDHAPVEILAGGGLDGEARVDAGGVGVPDGQIEGGDGLAGGDVEDLEVEEEVVAGLGGAEVGV